jgi:hypothetical protein
MVETPWHRYYECSANDQAENKLIHNDPWLVRKAKESPQHECLWLRGLQPNSFWAREASRLPVHEADKVRFGTVEQGTRDWTQSFTDGTGGPGDTPRGVRRGAAVAVFTDMQIDSDTSAYVREWAAVASRVPGRQTSQRAEVQALLLRLQEEVQSGAPWATDSMATLTGQQAYGAARWGRCAGTNGDLWETVYDIIDAADEEVVGRHCFSHLAPSAIGSNAEGKKTIVAADCMGNGLADSLVDLYLSRCRATQIVKGGPSPFYAGWP